MVMPSFPIRIILALAANLVVLALTYPTAFVLVHGLVPAGWPTGELDPLAWFDHLSRLYRVKTDLMPVVALLSDMLFGRATPLPYGGWPIGYGLMSLLAVVPFLILVGGGRRPARHGSTRYGDARWATPRVLASMRRGIELGRDPITGRAVRVLIEGNLLTIAPPRTGKTSSLILPNLVLPEAGAWAGPVVIIDPKGEIVRAVRRRREALGQSVRCVDPMNLIGGIDRWNPILNVDSQDTLALLAMAANLLPEPKGGGDANQYFRDRAGVLVAAALCVALTAGRADTAATIASDLVRDPDTFARVLAGRADRLSIEARGILAMDPRSRDPLVSTAGQALQFLLDERLRAALSDHTFELADLAAGDVDLFIVTPADERRKILAPYLRWILGSLFDAVRRNRPAERLVVIIDEANVLGPVDAILKGVGELPGYGVSLWTIWQSRAQIVDTYGAAGADVLLDTAEVVTVFNTSRARPEEAEYWSRALGAFTGVSVSSAPAAHGCIAETRSAVEERLVPPSELSALTRTHTVHFLFGEAHTSDPLLLHKAKPFKEARFHGLVDPIVPVGRIRA